MIRLATQFLLSFLGFRGASLILLQNNNELRATGGFITSVLELSRFKIKQRSVFGELDQHPKLQGPKPLMEMLKDGHFKSWTFRDANYFPDFGESSGQLIHFYKQVFPNTKVSALLAINFSFIENVHRVLGTLKLKGRRLASHELFYFLTAEVSDIDRHSREALASRKGVLVSLAKKILLASLLRFWTWPALLVLVRRSFKNRDLQFYDANFKRTFTYDKGQDFLAIIESNFLGLKSNRYLQRSVVHETRASMKGEFQNDLRIVWEHLGSLNRPLSGKYQAYIRIYLPAMIEELRHFSSHPLGAASVYREGMFQVFGFKLFLQPGEKFLLNLSYRLQKKTLEKYSFKYFKQSGVQRESLQKSAIYPKSYALLPDLFGRVSENVYTYSVAQVEEDICLNLQADKARRSPRILKHEIISPTTILLRFSEPVQLKKNLQKQFILKQKGKGDSYPIKKARLLEEACAIHLTVDDLPKVEEEFYELTLKDVLSEEGTAVQPNPRTVTVVYRSKHFTKMHEQ